MSKRRYLQISHGDWFEPSDQGSYYDRCCDCGLTHELKFRVVKGRVQFQTFVRARETAAARRGKTTRRTLADLARRARGLDGRVR